MLSEGTEIIELHTSHITKIVISDIPDIMESRVAESVIEEVMQYKDELQ